MSPGLILHRSKLLFSVHNMMFEVLQFEFVFDCFEVYKFRHHGFHVSYHSSPGVYAAGFRRSNWMRIDDNGELELAFPAVDGRRLSPLIIGQSSESSDSVDVRDSLKSCPSVSPQIASGENIKMNLGEFDYKSLQKYQILVQDLLRSLCIV